MGRGMPRPLSCSWPSELFLFTMMLMTAAAARQSQQTYRWGSPTAASLLSATLYPLPFILPSPPAPLLHLLRLCWCKMAAGGREEIGGAKMSASLRFLPAFSTSLCGQLRHRQPPGGGRGGGHRPGPPRDPASPSAGPRLPPPASSSSSSSSGKFPSGANLQPGAGRLGTASPPYRKGKGIFLPLVCCCRVSCVPASLPSRKAAALQEQKAVGRGDTCVPPEGGKGSKP